MNMLAAMYDTLDAAIKGGMSSADRDSPEGLSFSHLRDMAGRATLGDFSDGKLGRWLGWMQAAVVAGTNGKVTLEDMKTINRMYADEP